MAHTDKAGATLAAFLICLSGLAELRLRQMPNPEGRLPSYSSAAAPAAAAAAQNTATAYMCQDTAALSQGFNKGASAGSQTRLHTRQHTMHSTVLMAYSIV